MAAIDKIYCDSKDRFMEFYQWCKNHNKESIRTTGVNLLRHFYVTPETFDKIFENNDHQKIPITNFPTIADLWILNTCQIDWIQEMIKNQYQIK